MKGMGADGLEYWAEGMVMERRKWMQTVGNIFLAAAPLAVGCLVVGFAIANEWGTLNFLGTVIFVGSFCIALSMAAVVRPRVTKADLLLAMVPISCAVAVAMGIFWPRRGLSFPFQGALALGVGCASAYVVYRAAGELANWRGLLRYLSGWNLVLAAVPWLLMEPAIRVADNHYSDASWWLVGWQLIWTSLTFVGGWRGLWAGVVIGLMSLMVRLELLFLLGTPW